MPNYRLITTLTSYSPSSTLTDSSFPESNLLLYGNLFRPWKTTAQNTVANLTLDVGSGNTFSGLVSNPGIFLDDLNVSSLMIQGNTIAASWGAPPWNQAVAINKDEWSQRRKGFFQLSDLSTAVFSYQFLNIQIPAQTVVSGTVYNIGRIALGSITELLANPLYELERTLVDPVLTNQFLDGGYEVLEIGHRYIEFRIHRESIGASEISEELSIQSISRGTPFVLWNSDLSGTQYGWMVRRFEDAKIGVTFLDVYRNEWIFREVL